MSKTSVKKDPADVAAEENFLTEQKVCGKADNLLTALLFLCLIAFFLLLFFFLPKQSYSKTENKLLSSFPELTAESLFGKKFFKTVEDSDAARFTKRTEDYIEDHFPFKEKLVEGYALYSLATGRGGSGGVILGKDRYLISKETYADNAQKDNLESLESIISLLSEKLPSTVAVAYTGSQVMTEKYPADYTGQAVFSNRALINEAFGGDKPYTFVDLYEPLASHAQEEIYYRTDHHWTTLGAFYGVSALYEAVGKEPLSLADYRVERATNDFHGTLYNRAGMYWLPGEGLDRFRYEGDENYTVSFLNAAGAVTRVTNLLYDDSCLDEDYHGTAYDSFVTPVGPMLTISKGEEGRKTLLVLKDSYAHCALPFLARDYDLAVLDIRSHLAYAEKLISEGAVDGLLVLVSSDTLLS